MRRRALLGLLLASPAGAAPDPGWRATMRDDLLRAAAFLCADCNNDIETEGVNRPMRRALLAAGTLTRVRDALEVATARGEARYAAVLGPVRRALLALEEMDERAALQAIRRATRILDSVPA